VSNPFVINLDIAKADMQKNHRADRIGATRSSGASYQ